MSRKHSLCALPVLIMGATAAVAQPASCPVTLVNDGRGGGYQNEALKVGLWPNGTVTFQTPGPGQIDTDGSMAMKFWWWRLEPGQLKIEGRRLDADAPPLRADIPEGYGPKGFQAVGLIFPTVGCWEVTGRLGDEELKFVTWVERLDEEPPRAVKR